MVLDALHRIREGYSQGYYKSKRYGMTKTTFNRGKSIKFYAEELGGKDVVSLNYYITNSKEWLKPCEMEAEKVICFLLHVKTD